MLFLLFVVALRLVGVGIGLFRLAFSGLLFLDWLNACCFGLRLQFFSVISVGVVEFSMWIVCCLKVILLVWFGLLLCFFLMCLVKFCIAWVWDVVLVLLAVLLVWRFWWLLFIVYFLCFGVCIGGLRFALVCCLCFVRYLVFDFGVDTLAVFVCGL